MKKSKKILIRSPNWLGDAIMTTPVIHSLKNHFPKSKISVLAKPGVASLFEASPDVDQVIIYRKPGIHQGIPGKWRLSRELKKFSFDSAIIFPHSFESALISYLSRIPVRIGYATEGRGFLLSDRPDLSRRRKQEHQVPFFFHLLEPLGILENPSEKKNPLCLTIPDSARIQAKARLKELSIESDNFLIALAPGAMYGPAKCWPMDRFEEIAKGLKKEMGAQIIVLGTKQDALSGRSLGNETFHNLLGETSLTEALALLQQCKLMICNDSGLMHAASAMNIPLIALFGPTNLDRTGPWGGVSRIVKKEFPCSPCTSKVCKKSPTCMEAITVDEVIENAVSLAKEL